MFDTLIWFVASGKNNELKINENSSKYKMECKIAQDMRMIFADMIFKN